MKKSIIEIDNRKPFGDTRRIKHNGNDVIRIDQGKNMEMAKEEEKQIILDAVSDYILSCKEEEATEFIKELTDIIVKSCVRIMV